MQQPLSNNIINNRSRVIAKVIQILPGDGNRFGVRLQIQTVQPVQHLVSLAKINEVISAYPNFVRGESEAIDFTFAQNKRMLELQSVPPGSTITAMIYFRRILQDGEWLIMDWSLK